jgi:hypothetical protein
MPSEAEKTSRYSGRFSRFIAFKSRQLSLAGVDKSQVFALKLNREEFAKNCTDLIRRKFSIDADAAK